MGLKLAVVGGGSTYTPELVDGFARRADRVQVDEIALLDIDPERSILLALRAEEMYGATPGSVPRDTVEALHRAIEATRVRLTIRDPATGSVAL